MYAHVPDINDFTLGLAAVLKPEGTVTLEFPHLMPLIERTQFDTIYHEHFSYLSLTTVARIFAEAGLRVCDVEELPTHGGSLRVYGCHAEAAIATSNRVESVLTREEQFGVTRRETYTEFQKRADRVKDDLLAFLIEQKRAGRRVAVVGAPCSGRRPVTPEFLPRIWATTSNGALLPIGALLRSLTESIRLSDRQQSTTSMLEIPGA